jgi:hypothetical protein
MKRLLELSLNLLFLVLVVGGAFAYLRDRPVADASKRRGGSLNVIRTGQKLSIPNVVFRTKKSLVVALSATCHFCEQSAPFYQKLLTEQKNGTWQSILLFPQPTEQAVSYVNKHNYYSPLILHADFTELGVTGTPTLLLVDENGVVLDEWIGLLSPGEEADVATHLGIDPQLISRSTMSPPGISSPNLSNKRVLPPEVLTGELSTIIALHQQAIILDVRDRKDFSEGHISGALNIPADELHVRALHELSKKTPVLLYCNFAPWCQANGVITLCSRAQEALSEQGFMNARYIRDRLEALSQEDFAISKGLPYPVSSSKNGAL